MARTRKVGGKLTIKVGANYTINALQGDINFKSKGELKEIAQEGSINYGNLCCAITTNPV